MRALSSLSSHCFVCVFLEYCFYFDTIKEPIAPCTCGIYHFARHTPTPACVGVWVADPATGRIVWLAAAAHAPISIPATCVRRTARTARPCAHGPH